MADGHTVTLEDIYAQGQDTQERVTRLEIVVSSLARVDERLDSHSHRLRLAEQQLVAQAGDASDIAALAARMATAELTATKLTAQVSRVLWVPAAALTLVGAAGTILISKIVNGG